LHKRGNLLPEEVLKLVIAVLCIGLLIFLLAFLYFSFTGDQNVKKAQAVLNGPNGLLNETKRIETGGKGNQSFPVPNPSGWYIFSFVEGDLKPNSCIGVNCLCICQKLTIGIINTDARQAARCDDRGVCVIIQNLKKFEAIEIKRGGIFIAINKINWEIEITKK
jgi:hypothetical protein